MFRLLFLFFSHVNFGLMAQPSLIGLGEECHGRIPINARKSGMLLELDRNDPLAGIVLESSFVGAVAAWLSGAEEHLKPRSFFYPFWLTDTVVHSVIRITEGRGSATDPYLWGSDIQEDCRFSLNTQQLIAIPAMAPWREGLISCDTIFERYIGDQPNARLMTDDEHQRIHSVYLPAVEALDRLADERSKIVTQALRNRVWLSDLLLLKTINDRMHLRDSLMAVNLLMIRNTLDTSAPLVFWAADLHVRYDPNDRKRRWCGDHLRAALGEAYSAISVRTGRGRRKGFDRVERVHGKQRVARPQWITPCPDRDDGK